MNGYGSNVKTTLARSSDNAVTDYILHHKINQLINVTCFSAVVDRLYDASVDPVLWEGALESVVQFVGGFSAVIGFYDFAHSRPEVPLTYGIDRDAMAKYSAEFMHQNPCHAITATRSVGDASSLFLDNMLQQEEPSFIEEPLLNPNQIVDVAEMVLERTAQYSVTLSIMRRAPDQPFDRASMIKLASLFPHIRRALSISRILGKRQAAETEISQVLDRLSSGLFMLTRFGEIVRTNAAGSLMLAAKSPVKSLNKRLSVDDDAANRVLRSALNDFSSKGVLGENGSVKATFSDPVGTDYILSAFTLSGVKAVDPAYGSGAEIVVFIRSTCTQKDSLAANLRDVSGLTAAEIKIVFAMLDVGPPTLIASSLGLSLNTVRTHLRNIFRKTNTNRQSELIAFLLQISNASS